MNTEVTSTIKSRYLNYCYFTIANSLLAVFIGFFYFFSKFWAYNAPEYGIEKYFLTIAYTLINHFSLIVLCFLIANIIILPTILIKNKLRLIIQAIVASVFITLLLYDTYLFQLDGMHLTDIFFTNISTLFINDFSLLLKWNNIKSFIIFWLLFTIVEFYFAKKIATSTWFLNKSIGKKFAVLFSICLITTQSIYVFSSKNRKSFYLSNHLPFQYRNNLTLQQLTPEITQITNSKLRAINYPLQPLITTAVTKPKNILIIALDAWRADCFNAEDSPNLWQLAKQGTIFNNHISTANHTRHGLFGLFYGIPSTHWHNFLQQQQSPVLIDRLQQLNYGLGIFISTGVKSDKLDKTIFSNINNVRMHSAGNTPSEWDQNTTTDWLQWYQQQDKTKPWFSFVFYFAAHDHDFPEGYSDKYNPTKGKIRYADLAEKQGKAGIKASYKIAVHYVDSLAKQIIETLTANKQLEDTLIIITSDHGHELNDNLQGHWGHGTNFTASQLQVPFAVVGSKFNNATTENKRTSHYDVVPTLMTNFLGVTNNSLDYSIGTDLLQAKTQQKYCIATTTHWGSILNSFINFALVDDNYQSLKIFPSGKYQLFNNYNRQIPANMIPKNNSIIEAIQHMTRYLK